MRLVTLVRHGESKANKTGHWQGHGDSPLSELGVSQAGSLAERFVNDGWSFDVCFSSDLTRARSTALAFSELAGKSLVEDARFREIDVGRWEGLSRQEVRERFPHEIEALKRGEAVKIGGGESWTDLANRAEQGITEVVRGLRDGQHAVIFAHGGFIASAVTKMMRIPRRAPTQIGHMSNTSITTLAFDETRLAALTRFNDVTHLRALTDWGTEELESGASAIALVLGDLDTSHNHYAEYNTVERGPGPLRGALVNAAAAGARLTMRASAREVVELWQSEFGKETLPLRASDDAGEHTHVIVRGDHLALSDFGSVRPPSQ